MLRAALHWIRDNPGRCKRAVIFGVHGYRPAREDYKQHNANIHRLIESGQVENLAPAGKYSLYARKETQCTE